MDKSPLLHVAHLGKPWGACSPPGLRPGLASAWPLQEPPEHVGPAASHLGLSLGSEPPWPVTTPKRSWQRGKRGQGRRLVQLILGVRPSVDGREVNIEATGLLHRSVGTAASRAGSKGQGQGRRRAAWTCTPNRAEAPGLWAALREGRDFRALWFWSRRLRHSENSRISNERFRDSGKWMRHPPWFSQVPSASFPRLPRRTRRPRGSERGLCRVFPTSPGVTGPAVPGADGSRP